MEAFEKRRRPLAVRENGIRRLLAETDRPLPPGRCGGHTDKRDMLPPLHDRTYFARPVNRRTGKCGVDHGMVRRLFGALFGEGRLSAPA